MIDVNPMATGGGGACSAPTAQDCCNAKLAALPRPSNTAFGADGMVRVSDGWIKAIEGEIIRAREVGQREGREDTELLDEIRQATILELRERNSKQAYQLEAGVKANLDLQHKLTAVLDYANHIERQYTKLRDQPVASVLRVVGIGGYTLTLDHVEPTTKGLVVYVR